MGRREGMTVGDGSNVGERLGEALRALCRPAQVSLVGVGGSAGTVLASEALPGVHPPGLAVSTRAGTDVDALVTRLFADEGEPLVRLVRMFVDDRNAAEDLVQEGFIRLARHAHRIRDHAKAAAYLRSIVLNLARDHNRRGLVSLRHHLPLDEQRAATEDDLDLREEHREVIETLRELSHRQRTCLVLRYYDELGIDEIADTLKISRNSVKTHLTRGLAAMAELLGVHADAHDGDEADDGDGDGASP